MKDSILIVGGAGYIGSHIHKALALNGYDTVVYDNLSRGHREFVRWGTLVEGDLNDPRRLDELFSRHRFGVVIHCAAFAYVGESVERPAPYYENNVANTLNLLAAMRRHHVERLLFSSSCAIYGQPQQLPIPEEHPKNPINPYGASKWMVERILEDYSRAYGLHVVALRFFNAAGADEACEIGEWHDPETHLIPLALDVALGRRDLFTVLGDDYATPDGTCIRDFIHVQDLVSAHLLAMQYLLSNPSGHLALNLGNGQGFSILEVLDTVAGVCGRAIPRQVAPRRPGDPDRLVGSAQQAGKILGWSPRYTRLVDIVESAWRWHRILHRM